MRDLISRQAAIKAFYIQSDDDGWWVGTAQDAETLLNGLPSAERVGKWETEIRTILGAKIPFYACSECGKNSADEYRYCPNCGARMEAKENV